MPRVRITETAAAVLLLKLRTLSTLSRYGVNFLDTAEGYPIPLQPSTSGATDKAIGKWLKSREREKVIIATKVRVLQIPSPGGPPLKQQGWATALGEARALSMVRMVQVCGASKRLNWFRDDKEPTRVNKKQIKESVEKSLQRLGDRLRGSSADPLAGPLRAALRAQQV